MTLVQAEQHGMTARQHPERWHLERRSTCEGTPLVQRAIPLEVSATSDHAAAVLEVEPRPHRSCVPHHLQPLFCPFRSVRMQGASA
eukprot:736105-Rhodomonas_salina.2